MSTPRPDRPFLVTEDTAALWAGKSGSKETVSSYLQKSKPDGQDNNWPQRKPADYMSAQPERPFLFAEDIAALWSACAGKPVSKATVFSYLQKSKPGGRYESRPLRQPTDYTGKTKRGSQPYWLPEQGETLDDLREEFVAWWKNRPGRGVGGGRPRKIR